MEQQQGPQSQAISVGAVVEATDGLIGSVMSVICKPETGEVDQLIVQNDQQDKQFTIPASLIASTVGSQIVHLNIARDRLIQSGVEIKVDPNSSPNYGHHTPPTEH